MHNLQSDNSEPLYNLGKLHGKLDIISLASDKYNKERIYTVGLVVPNYR